MHDRTDFKRIFHSLRRKNPTTHSKCAPNVLILLQRIGILGSVAFYLCPESKSALHPCHGEWRVRAVSVCRACMAAFFSRISVTPLVNCQSTSTYARGAGIWLVSIAGSALFGIGCGIVGVSALQLISDLLGQHRLRTTPTPYHSSCNYLSTRVPSALLGRPITLCATCTENAHRNRLRIKRLVLSHAGNATSSSAFVYGAMSFADKIANGERPAHASWHIAPSHG